MPKLKLTKGELKRQKDDLRRFERFLPMLQLKKQQLQVQRRQMDEHLKRTWDERERRVEAMRPWIAVLGADVDVGALLGHGELALRQENIAGVHLPVFERLDLAPVPYDLFEMPLWVDRAVVEVRALLDLDARGHILSRRRELIERELAETSQRVNLFERVKVPTARENIRRLKVLLGDQETAAVVRGKIAKRKRQVALP